MKLHPLPFIVICITLMIVIAIYSGLRFKPPQETNQSVQWTRLKQLPDGRYISYRWYDTTGLYPFTKDTFGLDSSILDTLLKIEE